MLTERPAVPRFFVRRYRAARAFFARPAAIRDSYLLDDEYILYDDAPSLNAFLVGQLPLLVLIAVGAMVSVVVALKAHQPGVAGLILIVLGLLLSYLMIRRATQMYTRYVLTSFRVMKISGFLKRSNAWIPWVKVTDVRYEATFVGRLLNFATLSIDSAASELSGLKELKNLRDPSKCERALVEAVRAKQSGKQLQPPGVASAAAPAPQDLSQISARLAELLAAGPVAVTITYAAEQSTSPTSRQAVITLDDDDDDDGSFDATQFD
jgi:membrane protein YdbS with pleckstrin-like domain